MQRELLEADLLKQVHRQQKIILKLIKLLKKRQPKNLVWLNLQRYFASLNRELNAKIKASLKTR